MSLAATIGEDLFRADRLHAVRLDNQTPRFIRHGRDFEAFLDDLAQVQLRKDTIASADIAGGHAQRNQLTFMPDGTTGVVALIDGNKAATV